MELPPEIILCMGQFLSPHDLTHCIRISKTWHQVLVPLLYHSIDETKKTKPSISALDKYMHLIQDVKLIAGSPYMSQLAGSSPLLNLRRICLIIQNGFVLTQSMGDLFKSMPRLSSLSVEGSHQHEKSFPLQSILGHCLPSLPELHLQSTYLSESALKLIVDFGSSLEKLSLCSCKLDIADAFELFTVAADNTPRLPNISDLRITDDEGRLDLGAWMENCPNLTTLEWVSSPYSKLPPKSRVLSVIAPQWSHIQSLTLRGENPNIRLTDRQLCQILEACVPLTKLSMDSSCFSIRSFFSLERHFATLDYLDLEYCKDVQSWMSQSILSSCPRLVYFSAEILLACDLVQESDPEAQRERTSDFSFKSKVGEPGSQEGELVTLGHEEQLAHKYAQGRPWVCLGLRTLKVTIAETEPEWQESIFKRISTLTELRVLDLGMGRGYYGMPSLDLCLKSGLRYLGSLKRLERLNFDGTPQFMEERDVEWMLCSWPSLKDLSQEFNLTPKKNTKLCKLADRYFSGINSEDEDEEDDYY